MLIISLLGYRLTLDANDRWLGVLTRLHCAHVDAYWMCVWPTNHFMFNVLRKLTDDSAAHISEETSGAARAAPIAILTGVAGTASLGAWSSPCVNRTQKAEQSRS